MGASSSYSSIETSIKKINKFQMWRRIKKKVLSRLNCRFRDWFWMILVGIWMMRMFMAGELTGIGHDLKKNVTLVLIVVEVVWR